VNQGLEMYNNTNDVTQPDEYFQCSRKYNFTWIEFLCPNELLLDDIEIDDLDPVILESIELLIIKGKDDTKGPLTTIPSNICCFTKLKVYNKNIFY
jgi:hypothetical protein